MRYVTSSIFICVIFTFQLLPAQAPDTLWTMTYGGIYDDKCYCVRQTPDGGYIITGETISFGSGSGDVWLIKTDENGDTLWIKTIGTIYPENGQSIHLTTDGGYVITGHGPYGVLLIKTDAAGDTIWTRNYGEGSGESVQQTSDGGYIICGDCYSFASNSYDIWLIKTDALGDTIWTKKFGGNNKNEGNSVQQTADGGYIIAGRTESFGAGGYDFWLIKTDTSGDTLWTKTFGGNNDDYSNSVQQTSDEGYIIIGVTESFGAGGYDFWLVKTNASGDTLWTKTFGGSNYDEGIHVQQISNGGYILCGGTSSFGSGWYDVWVIRTNTLGDTLWTNTFGGIQNEAGTFVQQTTDGGYIICGSQFMSSGDYDFLLIKIAPDPMNVRKNEANFASKYLLSQNHPNPFNPSTTIEFDLPKSIDVTLKVFNILGEEVATLVSDRLSAGSYSYEWDASNLASGIYLYRLQAGDPSQNTGQGPSRGAGQSYVETRKMVLMR